LVFAAIVFIPCARAQTDEKPNTNESITLFEGRCAICHNGSNDRVPDRNSLSQRPPESILDALTTGSMVANAKGLTDRQMRLVSAYISGKPFGAAETGDAAKMKNRCAAEPMAEPSQDSGWNGWGLDAANTRFQRNGGLTLDQVRNLKLKWAFGFPRGSSAYGQPSVVSGRVFVGSDTGYVYSLGASTGCVYWSFAAKAGVRTAISIGPGRAGSAKYIAYFGDVKGYVYAVNAETGALVWTQHADPHPLARITGAPKLEGERLYVPVSSLEESAGGNPKYECCTFRGSVVAYEAQTGKQIWKAYTISDPAKRLKKTAEGTQLWGPAGAAIWSSPAVDVQHHRLYVATSNSYTEPAVDTSDAVIAFDLDTGKRIWVRQATPKDSFVIGCGATVKNKSESCPEGLGPDVDFGNGPMLCTLPNGRRVLVVGQKSAVGYELDVNNGKILWQIRVGQGSGLGGMQWGSAVDDKSAYFPVADAKLGADAGGLSAVDLTSGKPVWHARPPVTNCENFDANCSPAQSAPVTVIPGVVFSGTLAGTMLAFSTEEGKLLWQYNTSREFPTVNGVPARGGTLNGAGSVVAEGMLFVPSGYADLGRGIPGNVLLAFGVE